MSFSKLVKRYRQWLIVAGIILLAAFLRFYNLPGIFVFGGDEEYQSILAQTIVRDFHIIWVGVNAAGLGFYLGPFWTYFTALLLFFSKSDPLVTSFAAATLGVGTTLLVFFVANKMFGAKAAFVSTLLYATLPLMVFFDQKYWNPSLVPFLTLTLVFSIYQSKKNLWWWTVFAVAFGLVFHIHLSLVPLGFLGAYYFIRQKGFSNTKILLISLASFLLVLSPLIAFDYFQKGRNITTPLRFKQVSADPTNKINPIHHANALFSTLGRIWYLAPNKSNSDEVLFSCTSLSIYGSPTSIDQFSTRTTAPIWLSIASALLIFYFLRRKETWKDFASKLVAISLVLVVVPFLFFTGRAFEYYLLGTFPLILLIPGLLLKDLRGRVYYVALIPFLVLSLLGIHTVLSATGEYGLVAKKKLVEKVAFFVKDEPFELTQTGVCHAYGGWRYLFVTYGGITPERSFTDGSLGWLYPSKITDKEAKYKVVMSESRAPVDIDVSGTVKKISEGGFDAYILENF